MAGLEGKNIKSRIKSIGSTRKITNAMGLVASSKIGRAKDRAARSGPYFQIMYDTINEITQINTESDSPYIANREIKKSCLVVIGADRGLAGGYNSALFKQALEITEGKNAVIFPVGKKSIEFFERQELEILNKNYMNAAEMTVDDCFEISKILCRSFLDNALDEIIVVYTNFVSMLEQSPAHIRLLPLATVRQNPDGKPRNVLTYEPDVRSVFNAIVPEYVSGLIYGALCESLLSEQAARRTAMDAASKNAEDMLESLGLKYNRIRQGSITQELTEIVAGAEE